MKPVVIFRHATVEGPGYLAAFLNEQNIPWQLVKIDEGEALPYSVDSYSGVVLMGGPMSVNDDLPWIEPLLNLIREAYALDIPLLGHCLGGQLISKALGGVVTKNPVKEIGWGEVVVNHSEIAKDWFGALECFNGFHWHGETFSLPEHAVHLLSSAYCRNQAFVLGKHLAFQCHIEMTSEMVQRWCEVGVDELAQAVGGSQELYKGVQSVENILETLPLHCFFLNKVAKQVYGHWIKGLVQ
jgi:GMP synthase-like glutamine amidotransferase